jgi:hypothetical protein
MAFSGGSDMESALDAGALRASMQEQAPRCVADLTFGGTSPDTRFMAFRRYVQAGRRPATLVLGFRGYDIAKDYPPSPGRYVGNDAAVYAWGSLADFETYYPRLSFSAADNALRFLLFQATAIGAQRQVFWQKLDLLEQRLGLIPKKATNALGNVEAFKELEADLRAQALTQHDAEHRAGFRLGVWPARLVATARAAGVRQVAFVRLPGSVASERADFPDAAREREFDAFMSALAREQGGTYVNLAHEAWMNDGLLIDALHYSPDGARLVSTAIGRALDSPAPPSSSLP